jgi:heptosyltransferase-2
MPEISCRHFNGYKPCGRGTQCDLTCPEHSPVGERILVVHLEALGAVLRSTSLIAAIRRRYPGAQITWVTKAPAHLLLQNLSAIDRVLTVSAEDLLKISALEFDVALVVDKSLVASGVLKQTSVKQVLGFRAGATGAILPANREADELWRLGLSDEKKFFENLKSEQQLVHESLALGEYRRDEYRVELNPTERELARVRRQIWRTGVAPILGINTGCSATLPHKRLSIEGHRDLIRRLRADRRTAHLPIVLLGGPEDKERNEAIAHGLGVINSPTQRGLRDGLASVEACDLVFSGDSLGMHMAIGLKKWVVAWFGPSCIQEIDLYERGRKIQTEAPCSPCWKRDCEKPKMCYDQLDFSKVLDALHEGIQWHTSFSKPHIPEISSSPSPS